MFCSVEILVKCIKLLFDVTTLCYVETLKLSYQDLLQFFTKTAEKRLRKMHQTTGFIWSTYSCIQMEHGNMRAGSPHAPVFSLNEGIYRTDKTFILVY